MNLYFFGLSLGIIGGYVLGRWHAALKEYRALRARKATRDYYDGIE